MTGLENEGAARLVADIELFDKRTPKTLNRKSLAPVIDTALRGRTCEFLCVIDRGRSILPQTLDLPYID